MLDSMCRLCLYQDTLRSQHSGALQCNYPSSPAQAGLPANGRASPHSWKWLLIERTYNVFSRDSRNPSAHGPFENHVMTRVHWMPNESTDWPYEIRLHLFEDAAEIVPHNHASAVISMILAGEYINTSV
jgi:hypothetical protein